MNRARLRLPALRDRVVRSNLSQNHWALRFGLAKGHFSDLINGKVPFPSPLTREKLLQGLGLTFDELFEIEQDRSSPFFEEEIRKNLSGRYSIDKVVGEGASGTVYAARDLKYGRQVAIKIVNATGGSDATRLFAKETRTMASLQHPHILPVLDSGSTDLFAYCVTPLVEGGSLRDWLETRGSMTIERLMSVLSQVTSALELAHEKGVVHRDIKPENILIHRGVAVLTDFGLALNSRRLHLAADETSGCGTPLYSSPEQSVGDSSADHRGDQYSLACVVFEMLAGRPPVEADTTQRLIKKKFLERPVSLRSFRPDLPVGFERAIERALDANPGRRHLSISKFLTALRHALRVDPLAHSAPPTEPSPFTKRLRAMNVDLVSLTSKASYLYDLLRQNARDSFRGISRNPGFAVGVALTLSLGVGLNGVMFGALGQIFLSPPPHIVNPDGVKRIFVEREFGTNRRVTGVNHADVRDFDGLDGVVAAAVYTGAQRFAMGNTGQIVNTQLVSKDFFPLLGTIPGLGNLFGSLGGAEVADPVAVISDGFWKRQFGADTSVLGQTIRLAERNYRVVGVTPPGFRGVDIARVDVWLPLDVAGDGLYPPGWRSSRGAYFSSGILRLSPGSNIVAVTDAATARHRAARADLSWYEPATAKIMLSSLIAARGPRRSDEASVTLWLAGVALAVLLIACSNVASLLLSRAESRRREIGVRLALGVSRKRLVLQLMGEGIALGLLGAILALGAAFVAGNALYTYLLPGLSNTAGVLAGPVIAFMFLVAILSGLISSIAPAWLASRYDVLTALKVGTANLGYRGFGFQSLLVVVQVGFSAVLLIGAGLFIKSSRQVAAVDLGFDTKGLLVAQIVTDVRVDFSSNDLEDSDSDFSVQPYVDAVERARNVNGVTAAGLSVLVPFYSLFTATLEVPGRSEEFDALTESVYVNPVDAGFFRAAGLDAVSGRLFVDSDNASGAPVALVSERFERLVWGENGAIGQCIEVGDRGCTEIVGVVEDTRQANVSGEPTLLVYVPAVQRPDRVQGPVSLRFPPAILVKTSGKMEAAVGGMLRAAIEPALPAGQYVIVKNFDDLLDSRTRSWRMGSTIFSLFGVLALAVAGVGLYSVLSYRVSRRRRELAVRSALGARTADQAALLLREGVGLTGAGLLLGLLLGAFVATRLEDLLFKVDALDWSVTVGVVAVLLVTGIFSTFLPAFRAARSDPIVALSSD